MTPEEAIRDLPPELVERFRDRFAPDRVPAGRFADDNDVVLFVHIPKTAGMSVGKALNGAFDVFHGVAWDRIGPAFRDATRTACYQRTLSPRRQVIMGHFGAPEIRIWERHRLPVKAAAIVREPVARFASNYNYNCSPRHPDHENFRRRFPTMDAYAEALPYDFQLSRLVGIVWSFEHALERLMEWYSFLGVTERLSASLDHFGRSHGLGGLAEYRINVSERPTDPDAVPPQVRRIVLEKSRNDLRLHALLSDLFGGDGAGAAEGDAAAAPEAATGGAGR